MVDTLGSLSLDSVLTQQSTQQVSQGLNSLKRVNLIQDIQNVKLVLYLIELLKKGVNMELLLVS